MRWRRLALTLPAALRIHRELLPLKENESREGSRWPAEADTLRRHHIGELKLATPADSRGWEHRLPGSRTLGLLRCLLPLGALTRWVLGDAVVASGFLGESMLPWQCGYLQLIVCAALHRNGCVWGRSQHAGHNQSAAVLCRLCCCPPNACRLSCSPARAADLLPRCSGLAELELVLYSSHQDHHQDPPDFGGYVTSWDQLCSTVAPAVAHAPPSLQLLRIAASGPGMQWKLRPLLADLQLERPVFELSRQDWQRLLAAAPAKQPQPRMHAPPAAAGGAADETAAHTAQSLALLGRLQQAELYASTPRRLAKAVPGAAALARLQHLRVKVAAVAWDGGSEAESESDLEWGDDVASSGEDQHLEVSCRQTWRAVVAMLKRCGEKAAVAQPEQRVLARPAAPCAFPRINQQTNPRLASRPPHIPLHRPHTLLQCRREPQELRAPWLRALPALHALCFHAEDSPYLSVLPDCWGLTSLTALEVSTDWLHCPAACELDLPRLQRLALRCYFEDEALPAEFCSLTTLTRLVVDELAGPYRQHFRLPCAMSQLTRLEVGLGWGHWEGKGRVAGILYVGGPCTSFSASAGCAFVHGMCKAEAFGK